jgi:hypothetical protein
LSQPSLTVLASAVGSTRTLELMSPLVCCFCADSIQGSAPVEIVAHEDGAAQALWAHAACLSVRLHSSVPSLFEPESADSPSVFLALTAGGLTQALRLAAGSPVWCGADATTEQAFSGLAGRNVTRFNYSFTAHAQQQVLECAVSTIREHHPGSHVWVEHPHEL